MPDPFRLGGASDPDLPGRTVCVCWGGVGGQSLERHSRKDPMHGYQLGPTCPNLHANYSQLHILLVSVMKHEVSCVAHAAYTQRNSCWKGSYLWRPNRLNFLLRLPNKTKSIPFISVA
jgi:hypothetical protein